MTGTGKTHAALGHWLIKALEEGASPDRVLCCSFSNAAADELRVRAAHVIGVAPTHLRETCSTIHSEALRRIMTIRPDWQLYDGASKTGSPLKGRKGPRQAFQDAGAPKTVREAALRVWEYARAVLRTDDVEFLKGLARRYQHAELTLNVDTLLQNIADYEREKQAGPLIDFSDMLTRATTIAGRELELLLVDEFQDTSPAQLKLIRNWMKYARCVVLIGDPDQCVHSWNGADPQPLNDYIRGADDFVARRLAKSYRVPVAPHALARAIITRNVDRIDAPYDPADAPGEVEQVTQGGFLMEAAEVAALNTWGDEEWEELQGFDVMALARDRNGVTMLAKELAERGIPFVNERGSSPVGAASVARAVYALLKLNADGFVDGYSFHVLLARLPVKPSGVFTATKKSIQDAAPGGPKHNLYVAQLDEMGFDASRVKAAEPLDLPELVKNVSRKRALSYLLTADRFGLEALIRRPNIVVTTMHASKGREAEIVFVDGRKPYPVQLMYQGHNVAEIESERRVLYVACTRARRRLLIGLGADEVYGELRSALHACV